MVSAQQNSGMLEDPRLQNHRKARLRELIDNAHGGVIARLADVIDRSESYIGRMLYPVDKKGARPVSDKLAQLIERTDSLERGWFDLPLGAALPYPDLGAAPGAPDPNARRADDSLGQKSAAAAIVWPFKLAQYTRLKALTAALGRRAPEAVRDMDEHLDILMAKWEREAARHAPANRRAAA